MRQNKEMNEELLRLQMDRKDQSKETVVLVNNQNVKQSKDGEP